MARRNSDKRRLNENDLDGIWEASTDRVTHAAFRVTRRMTRDEIVVAIKQKNSYRWWRIQMDYRWLRKQMKKLGQNPDDARELL